MKVFICGSVDPRIKPQYLEGIDKIADYFLKHNDGIMCVGSTAGTVGTMYKKMIEGDGFVDIIVPAPYADEAAGMIANSITQVDTLFTLQQIALKNTRATLVLPGGNGTLAELYMITDSIKSEFDTDLVLIYNINGFFDNIKKMNEFMLEAGVLHEWQNKFFTFCNNADEVIEAFDNWREKLAKDERMK